jgi:3'-5' exonuclease
MLRLDNLFVIDIETVSVEKDFTNLPTRMQELWHKKHLFLRIEDKTPEETFAERAGIYAEFGKIIVIGIGFFHTIGAEKHLKVKALASDNEKQLLTDFAEILNKRKGVILAGHNSKEFDFPYLCRRYLINGLPIPEPLQIMGMKPWEVKHMDTLDMWKFGDYKNFTSLDLLSAVFNIDSSKQDIDGSQVSTVYYHEKNLNKIAEYCKRDIVVTAQVLLKLNNLDVIPKDNIEVV